MKQLTCELCGGNDIVKEGDFFVCQHCGTKYSPEEAKKLIIEGSIKIDNSSFVEKYLENARRAKEKEDWEEVEKYYNMVEQNDPNNIEAIFYSAYGKAKASLTSDDIYKRKAAFKVLKNCISIIDDKYDASKTEENKFALISIAGDLGTMICSSFVFTEWTDQFGNVTKTDKDETICLFSGLVYAFEETIKNIEKIDDQPFLHEAAIGFYIVAENAGHRVSFGEIAKERARLKECVAKITEKECSELSEEEILNKALEMLDNKEYNMSLGYFNECIKKNSESVVGYLGKALSHLAIEEYEESVNNVVIASKCTGVDANDEIIKNLVSKSVGCLNRTLLVNAAAFANPEAVKFLIDIGSDVNFKSSSIKTALWYVCSSKCVDEEDQIKARKCAKLLLEAGADPTVKSINGIPTFNKKTDPEIVSMIKAKYPNLEAEKVGGCYVATCVYGSYDCPEVWTLRRYRDNTLGATWYGRLFIRTYYAISPTLVKWFGKTNWFKKMWRGKLDRMVKRLQAQGVENTPYNDKNW